MLHISINILVGICFEISSEFFLLRLRNRLGVLNVFLESSESCQNHLEFLEFLEISSQKNRVIYLLMASSSSLTIQRRVSKCWFRNSRFKEDLTTEFPSNNPMIDMKRFGNFIDYNSYLEPIEFC